MHDQPIKPGRSTYARAFFLRANSAFLISHALCYRKLMDTIKKIISLLADGQLHSGAEIGHVLGVTRSAVWKSMKRLADYGLEVDSIAGQGYQLSGGLELLEKDKISANIPAPQQTLIDNLILLSEVDSTNRYILDYIKANPDTMNICLAEHQTQGRGRRGRQWISPFGKNIYLSCNWSFTEGPSALTGLTIVMGIATVKALQAYGVKDAQLKWPNDVFWHGRKLAGILTEMNIDSVGVCHAVIGIGINLALSNSCAEKISQPWVDLSHILQQSIQRNHLVGLLITELLQALQQFEQSGLASFMNEWAEYDFLKGKSITLQTITEDVSGVVEGIDNKGGLQIHTQGGLKSFHAGEVSIKW